MKYFKPELLARCRSADDEVTDPAAGEWEQAIQAYRQRLRSIRSHLPTGARRLLSRVTLHDAKLLDVILSKKLPRLALVIRLPGTSSQQGKVLNLDYFLVTKPHSCVTFTKHSPPSTGAGERWVLYDEFDLNEQEGFFTHSLLLTGSFEEEIHLSPLDLPEGERTWPLIEA